ncbi:uncharacterized protein LOC110833838 [Zootermopsis nevadensis]|uniref:Uncharacterized protein n=1 Tax=Zootermopsis nevadensis TaxID=136037 RepID=A0A067R9I8_ZOONE|nr:uncharacterized protein LOC110833838 [Zootermopsis nevadensis]KDR15198.1 hypothetical protein L798_10971 [Zootermopsis nevadensis]
MKCLFVFALVFVAFASSQILVSSGLYGVPGVLPGILPAALPAPQAGYVAATRGSLHVVPGNIPIASQHLNLAPAPGTI